MDELDDAILAILRGEARISYSELGRRVGLSPNAAAARMRRLETTGVVLGYRAVLADEDAAGGAAGDGVAAFVDVRLGPDVDSDAFGVWVVGAPGVRDAAHVTGPYDYLLSVRVRDTAALDDLLRRVKRSGATQTQTRLVLRHAR